MAPNRKRIDGKEENCNKNILKRSTNNTSGFLHLVTGRDPPISVPEGGNSQFCDHPRFPVISVNFRDFPDLT